MLKQLRQKKVMKRVLWVLAIIIIPAFVLWGAGGLRESGTNYAGVIFGKKVSFEKYRASYDAAKNVALLTYGSSFFELRDQLNLEATAWERLIMLEEAKRLRLKVSDDEVVARIAALPVFRGKGGYFNPQNYDAILRNTLRTTPRSFEEDIRQSLLIEKLIRNAVGVFLDVSEEEIDEALKKEELAKSEETVPAETSPEAKAETPEEKRESAKNTVLLAKRMELYQTWRAGLIQKARLINNIPAPEKEPGEEETQEEIPEGGTEE